jgi:hypothetical protein
MDKSIVQPIIKDLKKTHTPKASEPPKKPACSGELDQDAGGGYNPDGTYPQT